MHVRTNPSMVMYCGFFSAFTGSSIDSSTIYFSM